METIRRRAGGGVRRIAESAGLVIAGGEGAYAYDETGRRYLDFVSAYGVAGLGHAHPLWTERVQHQAATLVATPFYNRPLSLYLDKLSAFLPEGLDRVALFSGGTEASETAIRLAQSASGRRKIVSFQGAFHGKTAGVRFTGGRFEEERHKLATTWLEFEEYPRCIAHDVLTYPRCDDEGASTLSSLRTRSDADDVAAVIVEPILGTGGNVPPERRFLQALRRVCDDKGWLLILDESITGFGRLGTPFAADFFAVRPDVVILGKAMGGGFPLSGVAAASDLWHSSVLAEPSATSSSYGSNPLACTAGIAVLDVVTDSEVLHHVQRVSGALARGLCEVSERSSRMAAPRGVGLMLGFDIVNPQTGELAGAEECAKVFNDLREAGVLAVADVPKVRLYPPVVTSLADVDYFLDVLDKVVA